MTFLLTSCGDDRPEMCFGASDFGLGGGLSIPANPDKGNAASGTNSVLLRKVPRVDQVAPWISTENDLRTTGVGNDPLCASGSPPASCKLKRGILKIYVAGSWFPWGMDEANPNGPHKDCGPVDCSGSGGTNKDIDANNSVCFSGDGKKVDKGLDEINTPCEQKDGWGLYGLIALPDATGYADPNATAEIAKNPPNASFRTFRLAPLEEDDDGKYFILDFSKQCTTTANNTSCMNDINNQNDQIVAKGKLYFQIKDRHYEDNVGQYNINIVSGVYRPKGFIESVVTEFDQLLNGQTLYQAGQSEVVDSQKGLIEILYGRIMRDSGMINIIRAFLLFYITIYGLMFMVGIAEAKHQDMLVRLLKVGIIAVLISPTSWEFFNTYLFRFFTVGAKEIGDYVIQATIYHRGGIGDSPKFIIPEDATALSIYDILVDMLISPAINNKTLGLFFYNGYFWIYIVVIYIGIFYALLGIIRAVVLYFTSIILIAVLLFTAPIFIMMILFQFTRQLFENWLQQLIAGGMMLIVLSASMALLVVIVQNQIESLFGYGVCWEYVFTIFTRDYFFLNFKDIYYWYPRSPAEIDKCVTPINVFGFLFVCVIFDKVMQQIPQLIDALSNAQLKPISSLAGGAESAFRGSVMEAAGTAINYTRAGIDVGVSTTYKAGRGVLGYAGEKTGLDNSPIGGLFKGVDRAVSSVGNAYTKTQSAIIKAKHSVDKVSDKFGNFDIDKAMHNEGRQSMDIETAGKSLKDNVEQTYGTKVFGGVSKSGTYQQKSAQIEATQQKAMSYKNKPQEKKPR